MSEEQFDINAEILECARYGEHEELREYLASGKANVNHTDYGGNSCMHKAAANGEVECLKVLKEFGALHVANTEGNFPTHWAAQNSKADALKFLFENYADINVLVQNKAGRSTLTDAFASQNTDCIEVCLSHSSASEEKLIDIKGGSVKIDEEDEEENSAGAMEECDAAADAGKKAGGKKAIRSFEDAVFHKMKLDSSSDIITNIRELPITRADNPFGSEEAPEDDTTGLGVWPASIILARWVAQQKQRELLKGKVVVELGAGCGLPGIVGALHCQPSSMYITDIHDPTLNNCAFNVRLNSKEGDFAAAATTATSTSVFTEAEKAVAAAAAAVTAATTTKSIYETSTYKHGDTGMQTKVVVQNVNWTDFASFPAEQADVLLGSDLVYDRNILSILIPAVKGMLKVGGVFLYVAPNEFRDGMSELVESLTAAQINCVDVQDAPEEVFGNPLQEVDEDYFVLHFYLLAAKQKHTLYTFQRVE